MDISVFMLVLFNNPPAYLIEIISSLYLPSPPGLARCLDPFVEGCLDNPAGLSLFKKKKTPQIYIIVYLKITYLYISLLTCVGFLSICIIHKKYSLTKLTHARKITSSLFSTEPAGIFLGYMLSIFF